MTKVPLPWVRERSEVAYPNIEASGTSDVAVACPYCFSMLSDAQNELGRESASTYDVIELVAKSLAG